MLSSEKIQQAIDNGKKQADDIISNRNKRLLQRAIEISTERKNIDINLRKEAFHLISNEDITHEIEIEKFKSIDTPKNWSLSLFGTENREIIIAEGDSWFDYPFYDILKILEDDYDYEIESAAHKGDLIEDMAYSRGQTDNFLRIIEKSLRNKKQPKAALLSGAGNDAANAIKMLVDYYNSPTGGINDTIANGFINERLKLSYITIISRITDICIKRIGHALPIIIHGYDYPVPDGRGYLGGFWFLPGPWLEPGLREKGFSDLKQRINIAKELIDRLNSMLSEINTLDNFNHVHYLDLRGQLSISSDYKDYWENELHPTEKGFKKITAKFASKIASL